MISKGNWSIGKTGGTVVTDNGDGFPKTKEQGHSETEYYGGYLIAESILKKDDAKLISAAPDLLNAIKYYFDVLSEVNGDTWDQKPDHVLQKMLSAYKKVIE